MDMDILQIVQQHWLFISGCIAGVTGSVLALVRESQMNKRTVFAILFGGLCTAVYVGNVLCSWIDWFTNDICLLAKFILGLTSSSVLDGFKKLGANFRSKPIEFIKLLFSNGKENGKKQG